MTTFYTHLEPTPDSSACSVCFTISPASNSKVHRARPSGGLEHAVAISSASSLPDSFRSEPGRGSSLSANPRLPSTNRDGDSVIINTAKGRHQDKNIRNDARVSLIIIDPGNPYRYLEIRGRAVEVPGPIADAHLDRMAKKYLGTETYTYKQAGEVRVMYKIQAERVNGFSFPHAEHLAS